MQTILAAVGIALMLIGAVSGTFFMVFIGIVVFVAALAYNSDKKPAPGTGPIEIDPSMAPATPFQSLEAEQASPWSPGPCKVVLMDCGMNKIGVIRLTREMFGQGLKDALDLIESAPVTLISDISKENAEYIASRYRDAGANVVTQPPIYTQSYNPPPAAAATGGRFAPGPCDVTLLDPGPSKMEIRWILGAVVGLSEHTVEAAMSRPRTMIANAISDRDARMIKRIMESQGAMVDLSSNGQASAPTAHVSSTTGQSPRVRRRRRPREQAK